MIHGVLAVGSGDWFGEIDLYKMWGPFGLPIARLRRCKVCFFLKIKMRCKHAVL